MTDRKSEMELLKTCFWGIVTSFILACFMLQGCGAKMIVTRTEKTFRANKLDKDKDIDKLNKDKNKVVEWKVVEWIVRTNYSGTFEGKIEGFEFKGKKEAIQYPDMNFIDFNFGTKEVNE